MLPPTAISRTPASVDLSWLPPGSPNGIVSLYTLERRQQGEDLMTTVLSVSADTELRYVDEDSSISPYEVYEYRVIATNSAGDSPSPWTQVTTMSSRMLSHFSTCVKVTQSKFVMMFRA